MPRALITGIGGQDGSYLAELLSARGYEVHGTVRPGSRAPVAESVGAVIHELDLASGCRELVHEVRPDELYNLAAVSSVQRSWDDPVTTARVNGLLVGELLAASRELDAAGSPVRFVQASSAEVFGTAPVSPQDEETPIRPVSPYGASKAYGHHLVGVYRAGGLFATSCVLFNHESPRRPETFVTRKITRAAARISLGLQRRLELGNLEARRDWGWAPDYADALHRAAVADDPGDFVVATGRAHSVEDFLTLAFERAGIGDWRRHVDVSASLARPADPAEQVGDASKAHRELGWRPTKSFEEVVAAMVDADLDLARGSAP